MRFYAVNSSTNFKKMAEAMAKQAQLNHFLLVYIALKHEAIFEAHYFNKSNRHIRIT